MLQAKALISAADAEEWHRLFYAAEVRQLGYAAAMDAFV